MSAPTPRRPSLSLVVAALALLLATASTSYAAGVARNSVGTPQLKNDAVTAPKIAANAVTGSAVKNHSLTTADLEADTLAPRTVVISGATHDTPVVVARSRGFTVSLFCSYAGGHEYATVTVVGDDGSVLDTNGIVTESIDSAVTTSATFAADPSGGSIDAVQPYSGAPPAVSSFHGMVRAGSQPWVELDLEVRADQNLEDRCAARGLLTPLR